MLEQQERSIARMHIITRKLIAEHIQASKRRECNTYQRNAHIRTIHTKETNKEKRKEEEEEQNNKLRWITASSHDKNTQKLTKMRIKINFFANVAELFGQLSI